jgi:hypothetical protein
MEMFELGAIVLIPQVKISFIGELSVRINLLDQQLGGREPEVPNQSKEANSI